IHEEKSSFLIFRAGHGEPRAVPLAAVTRLEEFDISEIERVGDRMVVQYRGDLLPIVSIGADGPARNGAPQPVLVFSERGRLAGLAVDEVIDIIEDHLEVRPIGRGSGVIGTAVIHGRATEIIDVAHYLPLACPDWFDGDTQGGHARASRILLMESTPFFRGMLVPVLKAAGYDVVAMADPDSALALIGEGEAFDVIVADLEAPGRNGFDLAESLRAARRGRYQPVIGLASRPSPESILRAQQVGLFDFVAKIDREGLLAALAEALHHQEMAA
ncbi:MAG TPA: chemotaxis protein CheV, partial [Hyphomicrobium sp.]|nr:chemotaxis protein CheV [Hyphomicrobium sp.]